MVKVKNKGMKRIFSSDSRLKTRRIIGGKGGLIQEENGRLKKREEALNT